MAVGYLVGVDFIDNQHKEIFKMVIDKLLRIKIFEKISK